MNQNPFPIPSVYQFALTVAIGCSVLFFSVHTHAACIKRLALTTPSSYFEEANDIIYDRSTGLTWRRCALGQTWDASTRHCVLAAGAQFSFDWVEAQQEVEKNKGWRIPSKIELLSIVERACTGPAINEDIFPDTPYQHFWSSDIPRALPEYLWVVDFKTGALVTLKSDQKIGLRLVK